jgi:anti-sigma factor RsiW
VGSLNGKYACADVLALLSRSLDEELTPLEQHKLQRHLRDCPACQRRSAVIDAFTRTLRSLPLEIPSVSSLPHLPLRRRIARTGFPAAAAMIVASLGLVALQGSVNAGPQGVSPSLTVSNAVSLSPVTYSPSSQLQQQHASAAVVWLP